MFVYLGIVEQRINELLQIYAYIQHKKGKPLYTRDLEEGDESLENKKQANVSDMVASLQD